MNIIDYSHFSGPFIVSTCNIPEITIHFCHISTSTLRRGDDVTAYCGCQL